MHFYLRIRSNNNIYFVNRIFRQKAEEMPRYIIIFRLCAKEKSFQILRSKEENLGFLLGRAMSAREASDRAFNIVEV